LYKHVNHACWKERLNKETRTQEVFNTVVEHIRENRLDKHKNKPIFPFKALNSQRVLSSDPKIMIISDSINPSDPNSMKSLGPTV